MSVSVKCDAVMIVGFDLPKIPCDDLRFWWQVSIVVRYGFLVLFHRYRISNEKERKNDIGNREETKKIHQAKERNDRNQTPPEDSTV